MRCRAALITTFLVLGLASPAHALDVILNNSMAHPMPFPSPEWDNFEEAARRWEAAIAANITVTLDVEFNLGLPGGRLGQASGYTTTGSGFSGRPVTGTIAMNGNIAFFVDTTPETDTDFYQTGIVSPPWLYPAIPLSQAENKFDLLTLAIHEIGHALGMSSAFANLANNIQVDGTTNQHVYVFQQPATIGDPVVDYLAGFYTWGGVYMPQMEDDAEEGGSNGGLPSHTDPNFSGGVNALSINIDTLSPSYNQSERRDISFIDLDILADAYNYPLTGSTNVPALSGLGMLTLVGGVIAAAAVRLRRGRNRP